MGAAQKEVADAAGVTQPYISQLEVGGHVEDPSAHVVRAMEDFLRVFPGYLTESEEHRTMRLRALREAVQKYGAGLGLTEEKVEELGRTIALGWVGDSPPSEFVLLKTIELVRAVLESQPLKEP